MRTSIFIFFVSLILTLILTPMVRKLAFTYGAVDKPSKRKVHKTLIPRLGGISIYISAVLALGLGLFISSRLGPGISSTDMRSIVGILYGATFITVIGIIDDIRGLPAATKFLGQMIASLIAAFYGTQILFVATPFDNLMFLGMWVLPITIMWMVAITNAINLIDGLDGLATGIAVIAGFSLFIVSIMTKQTDTMLILAALCGAGLGFLRYNFSPASIFLGDSGSLFLGFVLAAASVAGVLKSTLIMALLIPVAVLAIPIFDTAGVIVRRAIAKKPIFQADKRHIHHRLIRAGFSHKEVVIIIYIACFILSMAALTATMLNNNQALIILSVLVVTGVIALDFAKDRLREMTSNGDKKIEP